MSFHRLIKEIHINNKYNIKGKMGKEDFKAKNVKNDTFIEN